MSSSVASWSVVGRPVVASSGKSAGKPLTNCWFCHLGTYLLTQLWNRAPCSPGSTTVAPSSRSLSIAALVMSMLCVSTTLNSALSMYSRITPIRMPANDAFDAVS
jgi:hypothetical protein